MIQEAKMTQTCLVSSIRPEPVVANLTSVVSLKAQNEKGPFKLRILVYVRGVFRTCALSKFQRNFI